MGKLIVLQPDGIQQEIQQDHYPTLEQLQQLVGGYIERVFVDWESTRCEMFIDEDGGPKELPKNLAASRLWAGIGYLRGPAVIVVDLQEEQE